jgi:hypothetical protein
MFFAVIMKYHVGRGFTPLLLATACLPPLHVATALGSGRGKSGRGAVRRRRGVKPLPTCYSINTGKLYNTGIFGGIAFAFLLPLFKPSSS